MKEKLKNGSTEINTLYDNYKNNIEKHGFFPKLQQMDVAKRNILVKRVQAAELQQAQKDLRIDAGSLSMSGQISCPFGNFAQWSMFGNTHRCPDESSSSSMLVKKRI